MSDFGNEVTKPMPRGGDKPALSIVWPAMRNEGQAAREVTPLIRPDRIAVSAWEKKKARAQMPSIYDGNFKLDGFSPLPDDSQTPHRVIFKLQAGETAGAREIVLDGVNEHLEAKSFDAVALMEAVLAGDSLSDQSLVAYSQEGSKVNVTTMRPVDAIRIIQECARQFKWKRSDVDSAFEKYNHLNELDERNPVHRNDSSYTLAPLARNLSL